MVLELHINDDLEREVDQQQVILEVELLLDEGEVVMEELYIYQQTSLLTMA